MFRPMRRIKQQLDRITCEEILLAEQRGVLAVLGDEGYPYAVPLDYYYTEGKLYFHGAREGHKIDAITAYPKASFCVMEPGVREEGNWFYTVRSVIAFGQVQVVEDENERAAYLLAIGRKYYPTEAEAAELAASSLKRVHILRMDIEHLSGKLVREK